MTDRFDSTDPLAGAQHPQHAPGTGSHAYDDAGLSQGRSIDRQLAGDDRSIGDIFSDLTANLSTLMRQEVALAKAEVRQSATNAGKGAGLLAGAGVAGHMVLMFLSLGLWWLIAHLLDSTDPRFGWAFVIVAVIWAVIAGILAAAGKSSLNKVEGAPRTAETVGQIPNALKGEEAKNR
ncbi:phage holin family protein [Granulicoccus sp. GXG6511]|uniref:phage holin family protein n=1 Tax=Granulicoccus sp. GXG6511 TaxID=3381351 RepID=UPI003D7D30D5